MCNLYDGDDEEQIELDIQWLLAREGFRQAENMMFWFFIIILGIVSFW